MRGGKISFLLEIDYDRGDCVSARKSCLVTITEVGSANRIKVIRDKKRSARARASPIREMNNKRRAGGGSWRDIAGQLFEQRTILLKLVDLTNE